MNVHIIQCQVSCNSCGTPIPSSHSKEHALRVNAINSIGSEIVILRERRQHAKKGQARGLTGQMADLFVRLGELGATLDDEGFIQTLE